MTHCGHRNGPHYGSESARNGRLKRKLGLTRLVMLWERLLQSFWPSLSITGLYIALALFSIPPMFGQMGHTTMLAVFALGLLASIVIGFKNFRFPTRHEARRHIEKHSDVSHRPIDTMDDKPVPDAIDNKVNYRIWRLHQEQLFRLLSRLRVPPPEPGLARRDPRALRMAVMIMLIAGFFIAGDGWRERIAYAFQPDLALPAGQAHLLDLWITPPDYTGMAPVFLSTGQQDGKTAEMPQDGILRLPAFSVVTARVTGGRKLPRLNVGDESTEFARLDPRSYEITATLDPDKLGNGAQALSVRHHGRTLGEWDIAIAPDRAPVAVIPDVPSEAKRAELEIPYYADDDYGIKQVTAHITLSDKLGFSTEIADIELPLPLPGLYPKRVETTTQQDLTPHPWAGLPVKMTLKATDGADQEGVSDPVEFILPERVFTHPVAKRIIEERKRLSWAPKDARYNVARELGNIQMDKEAYNGDIVVFLALRVASLRLAYSDNPDIEVLQKLLWDTALRLEDGDLSLAMRDLREAQRKLQEALNNPNTPDEQIQERIDDLERAMERFMQAMAQEMRDRIARGEEIPEIPEDMITKSISPDALGEMMQKLRDMSESGARDAAREMLNRMEQMLDQMDPRNMTPMSKEQMQAMKRLDDLQELIYQQQKLLDQTKQQAENMSRMPSPSQQQNQSRPPEEQNRQCEPGGNCDNPGGKPGGSNPGGSAGGGQSQDGQQNQNHASDPGQQPGGGDMNHAEEQRALRIVLGEIMRDMDELVGGVPENMGNAENFMRFSEDALRENSPADAVPAQQQALSELQDGLQQYAQQMQQMMEQMVGFGVGKPGGGDPLGREGRGDWSRSDVEIPDEHEMRRVQEILRELRRRSGEMKRSKEEREYIERLLKRFDYEIEQ